MSISYAGTEQRKMASLLISKRFMSGITIFLVLCSTGAPAMSPQKDSSSPSNQAVDDRQLGLVWDGVEGEGGVAWLVISRQDDVLVSQKVLLDVPLIIPNLPSTTVSVNVYPLGGDERRNISYMGECNVDLSQSEFTSARVAVTASRATKVEMRLVDGDGELIKKAVARVVDVTQPAHIETQVYGKEGLICFMGYPGKKYVVHVDALMPQWLKFTSEVVEVSEDPLEIEWCLDRGATMHLHFVYEENGKLVPAGIDVIGVYAITPEGRKGGMYHVDNDELVLSRTMGPYKGATSIELLPSRIVRPGEEDRRYTIDNPRIAVNDEELQHINVIIRWQ